MNLAVEFLLGHGFRMEAPFLHGVNYLSREEQETAMEMELARANKDSIVDIHLTSNEIEALNFVKRVREQIEEFKNRKFVSTLSCLVRKAANTLSRSFLNS